ncbi:hypothetical protein NQD34_003767 [Periophthalmus magnuspinnatus]|nr:hypothetical protein NQD34_003767 [Periophthalmus magnuspinnatus]
MWFLKFAIFIWILYAQINDSDAFICSKGQRVKVSPTGTKSCTTCETDQFQPETTTSQYCKPCLKCVKEMGSEISQICTSEQNRKCKCRENFVPLEDDSSTCKCATGFTLRSNECVKEEKKIPLRATTPIQRFLTAAISPRPQEGTQEPAHNINTATVTTITTTVSTTTGPQGFPVTTERTRHSPTSNIVVGFVFVTVALLVLTALICKQNILPRMKRRSEQTRDASFRMPVEESGDGSQDSLKQNQEEP